MKTMLVALLVSLSLAFTPCVAAPEDEEQEDERRAWVTRALAFAAVSTVFLGLSYVPSLLINKRLLKAVGKYGDVSTKGLRHHFTEEQANIIKKLRAVDFFDRYRTSQINLIEILSAAARDGQHDIVDRVIELVVKHDVMIFADLDLQEALVAVAKHGHFDTFDRLLKFISDREIWSFADLDLQEALVAVAKHGHFDRFDRLLKFISDREMGFFLFQLRILSLY